MGSRLATEKIKLPQKQADQTQRCCVCLYLRDSKAVALRFESPWGYQANKTGFYPSCLFVKIKRGRERVGSRLATEKIKLPQKQADQTQRCCVCLYLRDSKAVALRFESPWGYQANKTGFYPSCLFVKIKRGRERVGSWLAIGRLSYRGSKPTKRNSVAFAFTCVIARRLPCGASPLGATKQTRRVFTRLVCLAQKFS